MNPLILAIVSDPECRLQIESGAGEIGAEIIFVSFGEHLTDLVKRMNPFILIVELTEDNSNWIQKHISEIKGSRFDFPVLGITGNTESEYARLERAGCRPIVTREVFVKTAKSLIETHFR